MLFDQVSYEKIAAHEGRLVSSRERSKNLWREEWDDRARAIQHAYAKAVSADTPEEWQRVCELARELRAEMKNADGHESIYFIELVFLTDLIEKSLLQARANPQNLIVRKELNEMREKALKAEEVIHAEYQRTPLWQPAKRRRLEAGEEMVRQTIININILSDLNILSGLNLKLNISDVKIDIAGAAKKAADSVADKASKIVDLLKDVVKLLNDESFTKPVKQVAEEVWQATKRFGAATVRRFLALKFQAPRFGIDDDPRPVGSIAVFVGRPDRQKVRWIVPGSGEVFTDIQGGPEMVVVPAGKFMMGSPDDEPERQPSESPRHEVIFAQPFAVGRFALTRGQFAAFVDATDHNAARDWRDPGFAQDDSHPVVCVSWNDAKAYAAWLTKVTGRPYRLLSEAEWEYIARAGTATPFWWGSSITPKQANYDGNYEFLRCSAPASNFDPNPWGLYNVHGNVWEWCEDTWHDTYKRAPTDGSAWVSKRESSRVVRGGSWGSYPEGLRAARRGRGTEVVSYCGFRLARTLRS